MEELNGWTVSEFEDLSGIYKGIGHPARISILIALETEATLSDVADLWDFSRPTVSDHVEKLRDANLVYQPEDAGRGEYELTPLGQYYVDRIRDEKEAVIPILEEAEKQEQELRENIQQGMDEAEEMGIPVDEEKLERRIQTEIWEEKEDSFNKKLQEIQREDDERIETAKQILIRYKQKIRHMEKVMENRERKLKELLGEEPEGDIEIGEGNMGVSPVEGEAMMEPISEEETASVEADLDVEDLEDDDFDLEEWESGLDTEQDGEE